MRIMLRSFFVLLLAFFALADAGAQTKPTRAARKKIAPYSVRKARQKAANINPHTGKPYGTGVPQDIKDGTAYLAPGVPMRKQAGYKSNGGYNDNRAPRPAAKKPANSSLSRQR